MDVEIWRDVVGYEGLYQISNQGVLRSIPRAIVTRTGILRNMPGKTIQPRINNCGYVEVRLNRGGVTKTTFVHRLLAQCLIVNPFNKPEVNHINGDSLDNRLENLEWVSHSENINHGFRLGLYWKNQGKNHHGARAIRSTSTGETFGTIKEAAGKAGMNYNTFRNRLNANKENRYVKLGGHPR